MSVTPFLVISASTVSGLSATPVVSAIMSPPSLTPAPRASGPQAGEMPPHAPSYDCGKAIGNRRGIAQTYPMPASLTEAQRRFVDANRVGRLATAQTGGMPHVIPVCYALGDDPRY